MNMRSEVPIVNRGEGGVFSATLFLISSATLEYLVSFNIADSLGRQQWTYLQVLLFIHFGFLKWHKSRISLFEERGLFRYSTATKSHSLQRIMRDERIVDAETP